MCGNIFLYFKQFFPFLLSLPVHIPDLNTRYQTNPSHFTFHLHFCDHSSGARPSLSSWNSISWTWLAKIEQASDTVFCNGTTFPCLTGNTWSDIFEDLIHLTALLYWQLIVLLWFVSIPRFFSFSIASNW